MKLLIGPLQPCLLSKFSNPSISASSALSWIYGSSVVLTEYPFVYNFDPIFSDLKFCGDNAAMIAWAGIQRYKKKLGDGFFYDAAVYQLSVENYLFNNTSINNPMK